MRYSSPTSTYIQLVTASFSRADSPPVAVYEDFLMPQNEIQGFIFVFPPSQPSQLGQCQFSPFPRLFERQATKNSHLGGPCPSNSKRVQ